MSTISSIIDLPIHGVGLQDHLLLLKNLNMDLQEQTLPVEMYGQKHFLPRDRHESKYTLLDTTSFEIIEIQACD